MYDVNSKHAEDFINHEEILETLAYAEENKHNEALIDSLIEKEKKRKGPVSYTHLSSVDRGLLSSGIDRDLA